MKTKPDPVRHAIHDLADPRAIRALAHPVRLAILELLHAEGTANATEAGRETGESPQSCSYHLRALAKYGFVREVASADGRETRWELTAQDIRVSTTGTPEARIASTLLQSHLLTRDDRIVADYLQHEEDFDDDWRDAAYFGSGSIFVTAEELEELGREIGALLLRYRPRARASRKGARRAHFVIRAVPRVGR
jgi:DNA-binding transcriptional ArsR family regulator